MCNNNIQKVSIRFFNDREVRAVLGRDTIQMVVFRFGCRWCAQQPRRLYQEPQLLEVSEDEAEEGRKRTG